MSINTESSNIEQGGGLSIETIETKPGCCHGCKFPYGEDVKFNNGNFYHPGCYKKRINVLAGRPFTCPKCEGTGMSNAEDTDSVSVKTHTCICNICNGNGYTYKKMKPIFKITGYCEE